MRPKDLDNNQIPGPFPTELALCSGLRVLSINNNRLCTLEVLACSLTYAPLAVNWTGVPAIYASNTTWPIIQTISIANNSVRLRRVESLLPH